MAKDLKELLSALNAHDVKYLVVGGYAIGIHAEPRATKDLDIFIKADRANSEAVFRALAAYGAPLAGYSPADFNDGGSWFQMVSRHTGSISFSISTMSISMRHDPIAYKPSLTVRSRHTSYPGMT